MGVIEEIRAGNKETIKEVYKENVKDVYNFAKSITGNHESALDATKKTFVILFGRIQKGEEPANIRLAALKIAYDEACAIAMPSTDALDSPYDKEKLEDEDITFTVKQEEGPEEEKEAEEPQEDTGASEDEDIKPSQEISEPEADFADTLEDTSEDNLETEDNYLKEDNDEEPSKPKKSRSVISCILLIINIILVLILLWFVLGLLQNIGIIPESLNLGHEWFNEFIYPLF